MPATKRSYIRRNYPVRPTTGQGQYNFRINDNLVEPTCQYCDGKEFAQTQNLRTHLESVHKFSARFINELLGINANIPLVEDDNTEQEETRQHESFIFQMLNTAFNRGSEGVG